jgi:DNA mismatch repair protein MutS2
VNDVSTNRERSAAEVPEVLSPALERFAAGALDWLAVRASVERFAPGPLARRALRELEPRADQDARDALARTSELMLFQSRGRVPLAGSEDPLPLLDLAQRFGRALTGDELCGVLRFVRGAGTSMRFAREHAESMPVCAAQAEGAPDVSALRDLLESSLDEKGRLVDDASPRLRALRKQIAELSRKVEAAVRQLAGRRDIQKVLADGHQGKVHRRAGRPVLAVKARSRGQVPGLVHDRSQTGETLFIEPEDVVESGNALAENRAEEAREESRLFLALTRDVLKHEHPIVDLAARVAELELAWLAAEWAAAVGAVPARQPGDPGAGEGIVLRAMRHPLLVEALRAGTLDEVVPLDLRLGGDFDLLVITGPNTGGKTLALKSTGLAVLLTRLGLPVPALDGTTVPLFDGIAADIGDEQAVQQNLSTFSSHLVRIRDGLARANEHTLVLLDELGGGTDPDEGAALGDAILEVLLERGVPTLCSTHLGKLKEFAFRHARAENASVEFDLETLAPRYRLLVGTPGQSRALYIARRLGLEADILMRAEERIERHSAEVEELFEEVRRSRERTEALRSEAETRLEDLHKEERTLDERERGLAARADLLEAEAQRGLEERLAATRAHLSGARALLPQIPKAAREALEGLLDDAEQTLEGATMGERRQSFLDGMKKGHLVYVPKFKRRLTVQRIWKDRRELAVRMGRADFTLSFDDVTEFEGL